MKKRVFNESKNFFHKHKIISFLLIFSLTIFLTRLITLFKDPNLFINNIELHHFHYGLFLLIIVSLMMLYDRGSFKSHLVLTAVSMGLIIDELAFISGKIRGRIKYSQTLPSVIITSIIIILFVALIFYYKTENKDITRKTNKNDPKRHIPKSK